MNQEIVIFKILYTVYCILYKLCLPHAGNSFPSFRSHHNEWEPLLRITWSFVNSTSAKLFSIALSSTRIEREAKHGVLTVQRNRI